MVREFDRAFCVIDAKHPKNPITGLVCMSFNLGHPRQLFSEASQEMACKRKNRSSGKTQDQVDATADTFPDSEDEFYAGKDRILLDDGPVAKRRRKLEQEMEELQPSDEEVLAVNDLSEDEDEDEDEDENLAGTGQESEEDDAYWGSSKTDYYNADVIETEQDALEEEAEARRLHQKQLMRMTDADFGFDELQWKEDPAAEQGKGGVVEKLPPLQIPESATDDERMAILQARYPEFEPLSEDLLQVHQIHQDLKMQTVESKPILTKIRAASAYMAAIAMYLAILASNKDGIALPPSELRDHPVMNSLLRCRQLWEAVEDMGEEEDEMRSEELVLNEAFAEKPLSQEVDLDQNGRKKAKKKTRRVEIRDESSSGLDDLDDLAPIPVTNHLESKTSKKAKKAKPADITSLLSVAAAAPASDSNSDFGDEAPLTHEEAAEKAMKKKSLRFYTSQIAQKANKRGAASRQAGGDDDIPYKERIKYNQARIAHEAESRANQHSRNIALDSGSDDEMTREMNDDTNDYYNSIVSKSSQKKADKREKTEAYAEAARQGAQIYSAETVGPDGKRKITYAIEKNKGLTPKRKKEVRNPRVKKKKQYEKKMKKLGSMRPVYKGGEGKGGYGGELTGIKTNVVKSVKL